MKRTGERLLAHFGDSRLISDITVSDLKAYQDKVSHNWSLTTIATEVGRVKHVFNYAFEHELLDKPLRFGKVFTQPTKAQMRKYRASKGKRLFTNKQIQLMLNKASVHMKAMMYLALNCGFGNHDVAELTFSMIDWDTGWVDFPRPKTGVERRCPLWQETIAALKASIATRSKKAKSKDHIFITARGNTWSYVRDGNTAVTISFKTLLKSLNLWQPGKNFYTLRHVFATLASNAKDQVAVNYIMGHSDNSMA